MCLAERLRTAVAALPANPSISIGVASLSGEVSKALDRVTQADHALYGATAQGRNRVIRGTG